MKIYQIYYNKSQRSSMDAGFIPYDNTLNPKPHLAEWYVWNKEYDNNKNEDYWGFLSWKFKQKMNIDSNVVKYAIAQNPGYDCYIFNPCVIAEAMFINPWMQSKMYLPELPSIANEFLKRIGALTEGNVEDDMMDRTKTLYCSYIIGNDKFWSNYLAMSKQIFQIATDDNTFMEKMFLPNKVERSSLMERNRHARLPLFPFFQERLVSTFLQYSDLKVYAYKHNEVTMPRKYREVIDEIEAIAQLKVDINNKVKGATLTKYNKLRKESLNRHSNILNLE